MRARCDAGIPDKIPGIAAFREPVRRLFFFTDKADDIFRQAFGTFQCRHVPDAGIFNQTGMGNFLRHQLTGLDEKIILFAVNNQCRTANARRPSIWGSGSV